jgi:uncharacterized protein (UPF0332 family)
MNFFNPTLYLDLANRLVVDRQYSEVSRSRTVINRVYYAAFLHANKKLKELGISFRTVQSIHKDTIENLHRFDSGLASKLDRLFRYRVDADYKIEAQITLSLAHQCIRFSEYILNRIETLDN